MRDWTLSFRRMLATHLRALSIDIDPTHIEAMRAAFKKVCDTLLLKCDVDDPMTETIVAKIVALAEAGEHDADRLAELVLKRFG